MQDIKAKEIMRVNPVIVGIDAPLDVVAQAIIKGNMGCVLVQQEGKVVGIITERDVVKKLALGADVKNVKSGSIMSTPIIAIDPETTIEEALKLMAQNGIRRLPVVSDGKLLGVVVLEDLAVAIAQKELGLSALVEAIAKQTEQREKMWFA
ncbi:hypothetical protein B9Q11_00345 [Candidatus Marsarchaeota G2 archaeon ECH_B_SAG-F08]|uniref:CBS domain-containing protein n=7 Tax=Candidatus Marsarchaeota TaxID=1978152 RepID=A0A2R6AB22_9ARCH|nr:MAG: hypothetical protein B9Q02_10465 [Candidatus Marsarchaeota G1 archaeon BE_D]PSN83896.1 MAG: hypothetical protein B9Q01_02995 [Candidatus Marsarchaeota G1 archaeon OSP_D]PSN88640.1 MAG: hypothetical protein B9Q00_04635 [Candidatus Marsarchaeota G1 archaeon OSP_C]PSN95453.1 MAG: hypothetical protein B9P99_01035 [Candidatus Marsarchaeota G1 archaeon OSP_B]PSO00022.1 MAG: hypothetical protein B9Q11_00345 [Candidatus Marsarchaeota G2 archaeon ECH_B_SAG-F08]PSO01924.1 MAG: hypothetical prote